MKTVLRIEHEEGHYGPYCSSAPIDGTTKGGKCPLPKFTFEQSQKIDADESFRYRYGFPSVRHLVRWFSRDERIILHNEGFVIREYLVAEYDYQDETQIVFDHRKAKCVGCRPLRKKGL